MRKLSIEELLGNKHPHASFHDAEIEAIHLDYLSREAAFECVLYVGNPDDDVVARERTAKGHLAFTGLLYFVVEPPDERQVYDEGSLGISYDGPTETTQFKTPLPPLPKDLPKEAFAHCFFINNTNSFMFVAATGARFLWHEPSAS